MDLLPALPMPEPSFLLLLLAEVAMGGDAGTSSSQLRPHSLFLPSSTVGVASPDLQGKLILPSVLQWQKFSLSYRDWFCHFIQHYWNDYKHTWPCLASILHKRCWQIGKDSGWSCKDSESGKDALKEEPEVIQSIYFHKEKVQNGLIRVHKYLH